MNYWIIQATSKMLSVQFRSIYSPHVFICKSHIQINSSNFKESESQRSLELHIHSL